MVTLSANSSDTETFSQSEEDDVIANNDSNADVKRSSKDQIQVHDSPHNLSQYVRRKLETPGKDKGPMKCSFTKCIKDKQSQLSAYNLKLKVNGKLCCVIEPSTEEANYKVGDYSPDLEFYHRMIRGSK